MTVAAELARTSSRLEYILCIEGIGWPTDEASLSSAWRGTVFVTNDLGAALGLTTLDSIFSGTGADTASGLEMPDALYDELDVREMKLTTGAMTFSVVDSSGLLQTTITPKKSTLRDGVQYLATISTALTFSSTTVVLRLDNPGGTVSAPAENDIVWVGGREAIKLGARSGSNPYSYANCSRAHLGTERGPLLEVLSSGVGARTFAVGTSIYPHNPYWYNRRAMLLLHVAGENIASCKRLYTGRISGLTRDENGVRWTIPTTSDTFPGEFRSVKQREYKVTTNKILRWVQWYAGGYYQNTNANTGQEWQQIDESWSQEAALRTIVLRSANNSLSSMTNLHLAYTYRSEPGGRAGAQASSSQAPQSVSTSRTIGAQTETMYWLDCIVDIGGGYYRALYFSDGNIAGIDDYTGFVLKGFDPGIGQTGTGLLENGAIVRFMLDNYTENAARNRFTVNGSVRRNVVDVALIFLSSYNDEFFVADAIATSATTTTVRFTSPGWVGSEWVGFALHCVEGPNKGEARHITANNTTTITVTPAFSSSSHDGNEYQIRNTIYDVLPSGWGMEVHNKKLDLAAWESVRAQFLSTAEVGLFALGGDTEIDLWQVLQDNIFQPFGLVPYIDLETGMLSVRFIGATLASGIAEDYVSAGDAQILPGSLGATDVLPTAPLDHIDLRTRSSDLVAIRPRFHTRPMGGGREIIGYFVKNRANPGLLNAEPDVTTIRLSQLGQHFPRALLNGIDVNAMFNTRDQIDEISAVLKTRLFTLANPPPQVEVLLDYSYYLTASAGSLLLLSSTLLGARNPYSDTDGLSSVVCRVLRSERSFGRSPGVRCTVQILSAISGAKIAPAARITAIATPVITVEQNAFRHVGDGDDTEPFAVGDRIGIYDRSGALKEGPLTIFSVSSTLIETAEAISSSAATNDYVTFYKWVTGSNTANMATFAALADTTDEEIGTGDDAKEWA